MEIFFGILWIIVAILRNYIHDICYQNSFLPSTIREWNSLPADVKHSETLHSFKYKLNTNLRKPPSYYSSGDRLGQVLLTRIQLGCSTLNFDLFRKSIVTSPTCTCGEIGTPDHYLLSCPLYTEHRRRFLSSLHCPMLLNNLIFGCENIDINDNTLLFMKFSSSC